MWASCSLALPSFDDEARLRPGSEPADVFDRVRDLGAEEVVPKNGRHGVWIAGATGTDRLSLLQAARVVDTSGAGDSFNAGYLAARLSDASAAEAARAGHDLAVEVMARHGAIIPRPAGSAREGSASG